MSAVPVLMLGLGGFLLGGAWAFRQQGRPLPAVLVLAVAGVVAAVGGLLSL